MKLTGKGTTVNYSISPAKFAWGRKSTLTLIALLASIPMIFILKWSCLEVATLWGTILGMHHTANVIAARK